MAKSDLMAGNMSLSSLPERNKEYTRAILKRLNARLEEIKSTARDLREKLDSSVAR